MPEPSPAAAPPPAAVASASPDGAGDADLFRAALSDLFALAPGRGVRVLDVGCGAGGLVHALRAKGYDALGTDLVATIGESPPPHLVPIRVRTDHWYKVEDRYELPFDDASFEAVLSSSTLEHVQDKESFFAEIRRVLRPGGAMVHAFPSRWYLPSDPHIRVPLVPSLWPNVPDWWLALWALLGVRNEFQREAPWREVVRRNAAYCREGLSYWSLRRYERLLGSMGFRDVRNQFELGVRHSSGGYARLMRRPAVFAVARAVPVLQQLRHVLLTAVKA